MTERDRAGVLAAFEATASAWAMGDAAEFAAWYADDATVVLPGFFLRGKEAIGGAMAAAFAGPLRDSRRTHAVENMRFTGDDTAVVVTRSSTAFSGEAPAQQDLATWVLHRQDARWLVRAYHSCDAPDESAA